MKRDQQYTKMATYFATIPYKRHINLDDIDQLYPLRLSHTKLDSIWYDWSHMGKLILHNGSEATCTELVITVSDDSKSKCFYKGNPLLAMTLRRLCCPPLLAEPGAHCHSAVDAF